MVLRPRLVNYLGWPWAERLTPAQVADDLGVCRYVKVPATWAPSPVPERPDPGHLVKASTETRQAIPSGSHLDLDGRSVGPRIAQVVFGGQLSGYQGVLPGILEEAMIARENGLGLFVVGGFGGAARALADFLCDGVPFSKSLGRGPGGDTALLQQRALSLSALARCFKSARTRQDLGNGLDWEENRSLMRTMDGARIVSLIDKGLGVIRGR